MAALRRWQAATVLLLAALIPPLARAAAAETAPPLAELVAVTTDDGVLLHGLHYRPARPSRSGVLHVPGGRAPSTARRTWPRSRQP